MNAKLKTILPKVSASEFRVNKTFSEASARAIECGLIATEVRGTSMRWLIIDAPVTRVLPNIGPRKESVRLLIDHEENFKFQVLDATLDSGKLTSAILDKYLSQLKLDSGYKLCPGVEQEYVDIKEKLKRKPNVLREWARGMRYDHVECDLWYNPNDTRSMDNKMVCRKCYTLILSMRKSAKHAQKAHTGTRKTPPKATNIRYLTPKTRRRTLQKKSVKDKKLRKQLKKI